MTPSIRCFIVDDELPGRAVLEKFIHRVPFLELIGQSGSAVEALFDIQSAKPDLIFLDIEMPEITGLEFLRVLASPRPQVIMVTASPQYAVEGFELNVIDYLLKPVAFDRFLRAINKVSRKPGAEPITAETALLPLALVLPPAPEIAEAEPAVQMTAEGETEFFLLRVNKKLVKVVPEEIVFIEAMKDYLTIHMGGRTVAIHMTLTKMEEMLPTGQFLRVNRSYIVRRGAIKEIDGNLITTTDDMRVPIGITYRDSVWTAMKRNIV
jgi:two-component system, LytTR family, response regulator